MTCCGSDSGLRGESAGSLGGHDPWPETVND